jgi:hypothetical protein
MRTAMARFPFHKTLETFDFRAVAVALGLKACEQGIRTLFTTATGRNQQESAPEHSQRSLHP